MNEREEMMLEEDTIDLIELLKDIWHHKIMMILLMLVCAGAMFANMTYLTADTYTSEGILYISNKKEAMMDYEVIQKNDIDTSRSLSTTYIEILKTASFIDDVAENTEKYTGEQLKKMVKIESINETELLRITVTADNGYDAYNIVNIILEKAPNKLTGIYKNGEVEIVDPPKFPEMPDDKGVIVKTLIGAVIGLFLGAFIVFIRSFFDTKVRSAEMAAKRYNVSVLGELPE